MHSIHIKAICALYFTLVLGTSIADASRLKSCYSYTIPVTPTSLNFIFKDPFQNNYDVVDFLSNVASRTAAVDFNPFSGATVGTATYKISATFCTPKDIKAAHRDTVLLASHGLNFDRSYWDPAISPDKYSFVDFAIQQGYSIFFYDRLGVGDSSVVSGFLNQASIQVAVLQQLARLIRSGKYTGSLGSPKSLVLVGHSFGSLISAAAAADTPDISDGLILTGFSYNGTNGAGFLEAFQPRIARTQSPGQWRQLDNGYLVPVDIFSNINCFFKAPDYDINVAKYADEHKQPFAIVEALSGQLVNVVAKEFKGAVMVIAGQFDLIFCTGQCDDVIEHPAAEIFAKAKAFKAISYPRAGHGLNFAKDATGAFRLITDFLGANGL